MNTQNEYKLNYGVKILSLVSGLNSFAMGVILCSIIESSSKSIGISIAALAAVRVTGDVMGYLARILAGFISDYSRKSLQPLLIIGYATPLVFKIMFLFSSIEIFSIPTRYWLFFIGNLLDKMFNIWRDIPRDIAVIELTPKENLQQTIALRKMLSSGGTALGATVCILLRPLKYYNIIIYVIAFIPCIIGVILLISNSNMFRDIVTINNKAQTDSKYKIYDNFWIFAITIVTVIILFLGKLNELYIFNAIQYKGYDTQILYAMFHFGSLILLYITYKYRSLKGITVLFGSVGLVIVCIVGIIIDVNIATILFVCLAYSNYNSMLDTILISTIMTRFSKAKYSALLLAIVNVSMGIGSLFSIKLISVFQQFFTNELSLVGSLIPIGIGTILIFLNRNNYEQKSKKKERIPVVDQVDE